MPVIQIPIGDQNVAVNVEEFASEATLQRLVQIQSGLASVLTADSGKLLKAMRELDSSIDEGNRSTMSVMTQIGHGFGKAASGLTQAATDIALSVEGMKTSDLFSSVGSGLSSVAQIIPKIGGGLAEAGQNLTNGATMLIGMMEKLGASFNTMRRVGIGFGDELAKIRSAAGVAGMQLDAFGALLVQNGVTIQSLADSTGQGAIRLSSLSEEFYRSTQRFGNFGMGMTEINQLLLDEIEIRRQAGMEVRNLSLSFNGLGGVITNNMRIQESMARQTGEDMRARLAAQREAMSDTRVRAALVGQGENLIQNFRSLNSALLRFDPTGDLRTAMQQSFATGFDPMAFAPELIAVLGPGVQGLLSEAQNAMRTMDPSQFASWFESNMAAQMETLSNNEEYRQQLIMMTHSTNSSLASSANAVLEAMTSMSKTSIDLRQALINTSNMGDGASFAQMSANMERFGAALSQQFTTAGMEVLTGIGKLMGSDGSETDFVNRAMIEIRSLLLYGQTTTNQKLSEVIAGAPNSREDGNGETGFTGQMVSILASLPERFVSGLGIEIQQSQLVEMRQMNFHLMAMSGALEGLNTQQQIDEYERVVMGGAQMSPTQINEIKNEYGSLQAYLVANFGQPLRDP